MPCYLDRVKDTLSTGLRLMIVDDDALSREVVSLLAADAGFCVESHETGDSALQALAACQVCRPDVILADLQMPGICGEQLAKRLRATCGTHTLILAMSGSSVSCETIRSFDAFVLKPFSMDDIWSVLEHSHHSSTELKLNNHTEHLNLDTALNMQTYASLAEVMPRDQLRGLYTMCLDDAEARIESLRLAILARDRHAWTRAAHSIKGGCGLVGAAELARMGAEMERSGLPPVGNIAPLEEFLAASSRLRRILDAQN